MKKEGEDSKKGELDYIYTMHKQLGSEYGDWKNFNC